VLIGSDADALRSADVMINLHTEQPPAFARFERLVEIVGLDEAGVEAGRERYRFYKTRGYALQTHDLRQNARLGDPDERQSPVEQDGRAAEKASRRRRSANNRASGAAQARDRRRPTPGCRC
jgi:hypothetical protein